MFFMGIHQSFLNPFHKQYYTFSNCKTFLLNLSIFEEITIKNIKKYVYEDPEDFEQETGAWDSFIWGKKFLLPLCQAAKSQDALQNLGHHIRSVFPSCFS